MRFGESGGNGDVMYLTITRDKIIWKNGDSDEFLLIPTFLNRKS